MFQVLISLGMPLMMLILATDEIVSKITTHSRNDYDNLGPLALFSG